MDILQRQFQQACEALGAEVPFRTTPLHDGSTHVHVSEGCFHWVATERGEETFHRVTPDRGEVLYWMVSEAAYDLALAHELAHREPGRDIRRLLFGTWIRLLEGVNPEWGARCRGEVQDILSRHPFEDLH